GSYTYLWSDGQTTATANNLSAGSYDVTVYDGNMCEAYSNVTISENPVVTASISSSSDVTCNGGSDGAATVTAGGGTGTYTYLWSNAATTSTITGLTAGTYDVTVYDGNMCEAYASVMINENPAVTADINNYTDVSCYGDSDGSATVTANGGDGNYSYLWDDSLTQTTSTASNLSAGTYNVTVSDGNDCEAYASITINENDQLTATIIASSDISCYGDTDGEATVNITGGDGNYNIAWNDPMSQSTETASNLPSGTYTVNVTDGNGCQTNASVTINEPPAISVSMTNVIDVSCYGDSDGSALASASGGTGSYDFEWSNDQTGATLNNIEAGVYLVTVTDDNGCEAVTSVTIDQPDPLELEPNVSPVLCGINPGACGVTVSGGNGGYSYLWEGFGSGSAMLTDLGAGDYTVTVEDSEGCSAELTMTVPTQGNLTVNITETQPISCYGDADAILNASCPGGETPLDYYWNTGLETETIDSISAGNYSVTVNDNLGCSGSNSYQVTEPPQILVNFITHDVQCFGESDGSVVAVADGGTSPYNYQWIGLTTGDSLVNQPAGQYIVEVTDNHNCAVTDTVFIDEPDSPLTVDLMKQDILCYGDQNGRLSAGANGGTPPYYYEWSFNGSSTASESLVNLAAGFYQLNVIDDNGCAVNTSATIIEPAPLVVDYYTEDPSCIGSNNGYIELEVSGGTEPYTYFWDGYSANLPYFDGLYEGQYDILVEDDNGCQYELETIPLVDVPVECLRIPNAFTPNGDDNNDEWLIENLDMFNKYQVQVFNRWGQVVYVGQPGDEPWDGTNLENNMVPTGSYIYVVKLNNGSEPKSGVVTVVY
ncbi:MAG: gliding motility-associated C-terminal domain-containing protein, partial [Bacteroidota bacterium]|nr:gliding motility-associated C-terminal domain-containing protein [Bacteroidota bacterium]